MKHIKIVIFLISLSVSSLSFGSEDMSAKRLRISDDNEVQQRLSPEETAKLLLCWTAPLKKQACGSLRGILISMKILKMLVPKKDRFKLILKPINAKKSIFMGDPNVTTFSMLMRFLNKKLHKEPCYKYYFKFYRRDDFTGEVKNNSQTLRDAGIRSGDELTYVPFSYKELQIRVMAKLYLLAPRDSPLRNYNSVQKLESTDISKWPEVRVNEKGYLIEISLIDKKLIGLIPTEIRNLVKLEKLDLSGNQLRGPIPTEIGQLENLGVLGLSDNQLTGLIPTELGMLVKLTDLSFFDNQLRGPIPTELGKLVKLTHLSFFDNQLTGVIPTELGQLVKLGYFDLSENQLTGAIPTELGKFVKLETLFLYKNQLTGVVPTELGQLAKVEEFDLSDNQLTGAIPTELGKLVRLEGLYLRSNPLTGLVPTELEQLENLETLCLPYTQQIGFTHY